ncbi:MAG: hypothetical protein U9P72_08305 [Campylobacterota bacterium]|nr:hypothetical protein [Campylobacterota bacterium]
MTAKITISTTVDKANLLTHLSEELGVKKNEIFNKAISYYADMVETSIINKRLNEINNSEAKILTLEEFDKATE